MNKDDLGKLISLRAELVKEFERLRDYKNNKNAIMKEVDHAKVINMVIYKIDDVLKDHVSFG